CRSCAATGSTRASSSLPEAKSRTCCRSSSIAFIPAPDTAWYVDTTTRRSRAAWCNGFSATSMMMVEQLGLAMMPWCFRASCALTSGTTSGTSGAMRNALVLSMTTAPALTASGASALLTEPPALKKATSTPRNASASAACTSISSLPTRTRRPALRGEASSRSSPTGKRRSWRSLISSLPTAPVAPTIATLSAFMVTPPFMGPPPPAKASLRPHDAPTVNHSAAVGIEAAAAKAASAHRASPALDEQRLQLPPLQGGHNSIGDQVKIRYARPRLDFRVVLAKRDKVNIFAHEQDRQVQGVSAQNVVAGYRDHDRASVAQRALGRHDDRAVRDGVGQPRQGAARARRHHKGVEGLFLPGRFRVHNGVDGRKARQLHQAPTQLFSSAEASVGGAHGFGNDRHHRCTFLAQPGDLRQHLFIAAMGPG